MPFEQPDAAEPAPKPTPESQKEEVRPSEGFHPQQGAQRRIEHARTLTSEQRIALLKAAEARTRNIEGERPRGFATLPQKTEEQNMLDQFSAEEKRAILESVASKEAVPVQVRHRLQQLEIFRRIFDETLAQIDSPKTRAGKGVDWGRKLGIHSVMHALGFGTTGDQMEQLKNDIQAFNENDYPQIVEQLRKGQITMDAVIAKHSLLQRAAAKYQLRFPDPKNEEEMLGQQNQLLSYLRGAKNVDAAAALAESVLREEFENVERTIPKELKHDLLYEASSATAALALRHREQWKNPSQAQRAEGAQPMTEEQMQQTELNLRNEKYRTLLNAEIAKRFDASTLTGARKEIWRQYNDMLDPKGEWFNTSDANMDMILDEVAINAPLIIASGGVASLARAGVTAGARSMAGRLFTRVALKEGATLTARQTITASAKKTAAWAGGTLVEGAAFEAVHSALSGQMPKDLPEWGQRILWSSATLGLFHGSGKIGQRVVDTTVLKNCFAKITSQPARTVAEQLLVKGHIEAATMIVMAAAQNGAMSGDLDEFYEHFGDELLHAYVTAGALKISHAAVETATGKVFRPTEKGATDTVTAARHENSPVKKEQPLARMDEEKSAEFFAKERKHFDWRTITTHPNLARSQAFEVGKNRFSLFWLKQSNFITGSEGIGKSLTSKCVRSAPGTPEYVALEKAEVVLAQAFHEAAEFLGGDNGPRGFYIEGSQHFGMERGNAYGIRVSSARTDVLLQRIIEGNTQTIREIQDFLRAEFVHEMVHSAHEGMALSYEARDEVASHAIQFLALEGKNEIFNRQMRNGIEGGSQSKDHYDVAQTAALKLIFQECTALAKKGLCLAPDSYMTEALQRSIASMPEHQRSQILKDMTQKILAIDGDTLLTTANSTPDLFRPTVEEPHIGDILTLHNELMPSGESIPTGKYRIAENNGILVVVGENGQAYPMPLLKGAEVFVGERGLSARGAVIPEGRYTFSYSLDEFSGKRTPVLIPDDGGAPYTVDFTKIKLEPKLPRRLSDAQVDKNKLVSLVKEKSTSRQTLPITNEEKREFLKPHVLSELSTEEYIALWRKLNPYFLSHVTRQGFRDHNAMIYHSGGLEEFHNGFVNTLIDGKMLRPPIAVHDGLKARDEMSVRKLLEDDVLKADSEEEARKRLTERLHDTLASAPKYPDETAVHFAAQTIANDYYGGETGNEVIFLYPSDVLASQYSFTFSSREHYFTKPNGETKWNDVFIWPNSMENPGIPVDAGIVFLPKKIAVDPDTGSKYASEAITVDGKEKRTMIEDSTSVSTFIEWAKNVDGSSSVVQAYRESLQERHGQRAFRMRFDALQKEMLKLGFDAEKSAQLAEKIDSKNVIGAVMADGSFGYGKTSEEVAYEILRSAGANWKKAEHTISAEEYWERYFADHPEQKPKHIIFYDGDPTSAVHEFQRRNGIGQADASGAEGKLLGFDDKYISSIGEDPRAWMGYNELVETANRIITDHYHRDTLMGDNKKRP